MKQWFTRVGEIFPRKVSEATKDEKLSLQFAFDAMDRLTDSQLDLYLRKRGYIVVKCPFCGNDNPSMIETRNHRREQMDCHCDVCAKDWVEVFSNVSRENIIPTHK